MCYEPYKPEFNKSSCYNLDSEKLEIIMEEFEDELRKNNTLEDRNNVLARVIFDVLDLPSRKEIDQVISLINRELQYREMK